MSGPGVLTPGEIVSSELLWISHVQKELLQQEDYNTLKTTQLGLFIDDRGT